MTINSYKIQSAMYALQIHMQCNFSITKLPLVTLLFQPILQVLRWLLFLNRSIKLEGLPET